MDPHLSMADISTILRLVRETLDCWDDPQAWRAHLLRGACSLLDGSVGTMVSEYDGLPGAFGRLRVTAAVGLEPELRPLLAQSSARMEHRPYEEVAANHLPGMMAVYGLMASQGWVTAARSDVVDDAAYRASPHYTDFRKRMDCDDFIVSIRVVDVPRRPEAMRVDRPHGVQRFGAREVAILKVLHDEIAPLIGVRLATEDDLSRGGLSARLRETLSLLLDGLSEKEAAAAMDLSPRTVHEYVTALYKHFEVSSRAELLAYFIRRKPIRRES